MVTLGFNSGHRRDNTVNVISKCSFIRLAGEVLDGTFVNFTGLNYLFLFVKKLLSGVDKLKFPRYLITFSKLQQG